MTPAGDAVIAEEMLPLSPRDYLIMLVLAREPAHGYAIIKSAEQLAGEETRLDPANLYRALRRLDRDGLVQVESGSVRVSDTRKRRVYGLTDLGLSVLTAESERLAKLTDAAREWRLIPDAGRKQA